MDLIWKDLKIPVEQDETELPHFLAAKLKVAVQTIRNWRILRRSVDARKKPQIFFVYTIEFTLDLPPKKVNGILARFPQIKEKPPVKEYFLVPKPDKKLVTRPIVVGTGPAGYFAALTLAENGYRPLVLERGDEVGLRSQAVAKFWQTGELDPESNVQFGEGGAGTFSDGKLTTRINDQRVRKVLEKFVELGADPEILYVAKPYIGTDVLKKIVVGLRKKLESLGGEVIFRAKVTSLKIENGRLQGVEINQKEIIPAETVILAVGHSARDVYLFLQKLGVILEQKPFAIGLRVEHEQEFINMLQYGVLNHPRLGAADYQLTYNDKLSGRGAYTFCMCPGGQVVAASSEAGGVVTNGMSNSRRDSGIANSAVVVTVSSADFPSANPLAGVEFQREWERKAFLAGGKNYYVPAQAVPDFLAGKVTREFDLLPTYRPGFTSVNLHTILPSKIGEVLVRALQAFDEKLPGFVSRKAVLTGIESRTSSPVRILRDDSGQSLNLKGLFPAGEGAGYAGGITSSAVDGLKAAEKLMQQYAPPD
ncbi:MAG TPA: FAD-dependent oxidoreductase [Peptococcaceae bacterium]|nr:FAD-dependent oxidoreductase [Peptococcaceae bacterium]